ncbi:MAG: dicarboxylate/amino acid:cation symporter [Clostridia bacterium]|nr:dicarboxylate/amino acid:cation symporter [Clostridia bacterium]
MVFKHKSLTYKLTNEDIDAGILAFEEDIKNHGLKGKKALTLNFSFQEVLLKYQAVLSEETSWYYEIKRRKGRKIVEIHIAGERCDIIDKKNHEDFDVLDRLGANLSDANKYRYKKGENIVTIHMVNYLKQVTIRMLIALVLGVAIGVLFRSTDSEAIEFIMELFEKLEELLEEVLDAIAIPAAFLSIILGIYEMGDRKTAHNIGGSLVGRILSYTIIATAISIFITTLYTGLVTSLGNMGDLSIVINTLTDMIPSNAFRPLSEAKALQVVFVAVIFGFGLLIAGDTGKVVVRVFHEFTLILDVFFELVMKIFPLFVFVSVAKLAYEDSINSIIDANVEMCLVLFVIAALIIKLLSMLVLKKNGYNVKDFIKNVMPAFTVALSTASSAAAGGEIHHAAAHVYKVNDHFVELCERLCESTYMPIFACVASVLTVFFANESGVAITLIWVITMLIIIPIMAVANPPVPGGGVGTLVAIFAAAGIDANYIAIAMLLELLLEYIGTALNVTETIALTITVAKRKNLIEEGGKKHD